MTTMNATTPVLAPPRWSAVTVVAAVLGMVAVVVLLALIFTIGRQRPLDGPDDAARAQKLADLRAADAKALETYGLVDERTARIPIEVAMKRIVADPRLLAAPATRPATRGTP